MSCAAGTHFTLRDRYKSTNTDSRRDSADGSDFKSQMSTQLTCFTGTKVHILTQKALQRRRLRLQVSKDPLHARQPIHDCGLQLLARRDRGAPLLPRPPREIPEEIRQVARTRAPRPLRALAWYTHFTCFTIKKFTCFTRNPTSRARQSPTLRCRSVLTLLPLLGEY